MEVKEKIILPEKYYHSYFLDLIEFVREHSSHLLGKQEIAFISDFESLSENAQCLFLRLSNRKGPYFRSDKLHYVEIDIQPAMRELLDHGFVTQDICHEPLLLKLFTKAELLDVFDPEKQLKDLYKEQLMLTLFDQADLCHLLERYDVVRVERQDDFEFIKLLYFGHYRGQMTEFVIRDVGNVKLEDLDDTKFNPWFESYEEARALFRISKLSRLLRSALKVNNAFEMVPALKNVDFQLYGQYPKSRRVLEKMMFDLGWQLEREQQPELAMEFYRYVRKPPARERTIRILDQLGKTKMAQQLAEETLGDYRNASERIFVRDFLNRPKKRINRSTTYKEKKADVLQLTPDPSTKVEHLVLQHFYDQGYNGIHCENFLWRNLFGLFFWEELFDQSHNNFHNPLQRAPSDIYDPDFHHKRKSQLENKVNRYEDTHQFIQKVLTTFQEKKGINNPFTYWSEDFPQILEDGVSTIHFSGIGAVLLEMSKNLRDNTTGFPDLFLWRDTEYQFYEVKSPNDHLSSQQLFWIDFMEENGINVEILRVTY